MSKISGLHTRPADLIHPASDSCYQVCPRTSLLTCWLDFSRAGFSRLIVEITHWVTLSNFIPLGGNPNDLGLSWRDVISSHIKSIKPEPEIFEYLIGTYNLIPRNTVFLDDLKCNIDAAKKFGLNTIHVKNASKIKEELYQMIGI
jgi:hypothetical protein